MQYEFIECSSRAEFFILTGLDTNILLAGPSEGDGRAATALLLQLLLHGIRELLDTLLFR